jgi:hypothetical protein
MNNFLRIAKPLSLLSSITVTIILLTTAASADSTYDRDGFWAGIDAGAGYLMQSFDEEDKDDVYFFLGFKGGYAINPHVLLGLELSGWLIEPEDPSNPNEGEGLMQAFVITQLYPSKESGFYAKLGGGYVNNWSNRSNEPNNNRGWGLTAGAGYDFSIYEAIPLTSFATFSYGETGSWDYRAITVGLGIRF